MAIYGVLAAWITWPLAIGPGQTLPGAGRTDLWNSLWSLWYVADALRAGELPWRTALIGWPEGGVLLPADPLNALLALPLVLAAGPALAYGVLVLGHLTFSGVMAHLLARDLQGSDRAGWVAGVAWACAPVLVSAVHNGTSEALAGGWLAWSARETLRCGAEGRWGRAGAALGLAAIGSWYAGVCAWLIWAAALAVGSAGVPWRVAARRLSAAGALGLALTLPLAGAAASAARHPDNLVRIKHERELDSVRRTTGPADPRGWFIPGDWRSPDFREMSVYGEEFVHCHYLGWVLLLGAGFTRRHRRAAALALAGAAGFVLAHGPVVVMDGRAWIVRGDLAVGLPYFLLEGLPGFSSLSLLYRLAALPSLALAALAAGAAARGPRWVPAALAAAVVLELRFFSPAAALPDSEPARVSPALEVLAGAPDGAVMNFPLAGGRPYLYEQITHGKPVAGTLNFPADEAAQKVWRTLVGSARRPQEDFRRRASAVARKAGIRYLVVHDDPIARPDQHDDAVRALRRASSPLASEEGVEVFDLWLTE